MTSADIRDVLSISNSTPVQKKKKYKPVIDPAIKNATGITRELYSLLGEGTPPIAFIKQDRFKDKPKLNKKAAPWYGRPRNCVESIGCTRSLLLVVVRRTD